MCNHVTCRFTAVSLALATCGVLLSCAPATPIRRTAIVPAGQLPSRVGSPLDGGEFRFAAEANPVVRIWDDVDLIALPGDPGLLIPHTQLGASVYGGLTPWLELGMQARYANYSWMVFNLPGVLPFPEDRDLWMYGFGARGNLALNESPVTLSAILEYNLAVIHQARFLWTGGSVSEDGYEDLYGGYTFDGMDSEQFGLASFFIQGTFSLHAMVDAYLIGGVEQAVTNIGFDPDLSNRYESTLESYALGLVGIGAEFHVKSFFATWSFFLPLESQEVVYMGPSFGLTVGATLSKD